MIFHSATQTGRGARSFLMTGVASFLSSASKTNSIASLSEPSAILMETGIFRRIRKVQLICPFEGFGAGKTTFPNHGVMISVPSRKPKSLRMNALRNESVHVPWRYVFPESDEPVRRSKNEGLPPPFPICGTNWSENNLQKISVSSSVDSSQSPEGANSFPTLTSSEFRNVSKSEKTNRASQGFQDHWQIPFFPSERVSAIMEFLEKIPDSDIIERIA